VEMAVNEMGSKPAGTAPPTAFPPAADVTFVVGTLVLGTLVVVAGTTVVEAGVVLVTGLAVVVLLLPAELGLDPQPAANAATAIDATDKPRKPLHFTDLLTLGHRDGVPGAFPARLGPLSSGPLRTQRPLTSIVPVGEAEMAVQTRYWGAKRTWPNQGVACGARSFSRPSVLTPMPRKS
jgi:hypothetical protein